MKYYILKRDQDISGNSGLGKVAEVFESDYNRCILWWTPELNKLKINSVVFYNNTDDLIKVHGHEGATKLIETEIDPDDLDIKLINLFDVINDTIRNFELDIISSQLKEKYD